MTPPTIGSWTREELAEDLIIRVPDRKPGRYNVGSTVLALVILAGIFGASSYTFSMVSNAPDATAAGTADWLVSPQKEEENTYLQAESVYHAFVEATYEQVDPELETMIREQFFDAIRKYFPEVPEHWYRRSMEILQRAKFGGKKLAPYEIYTLDCFEKKSRRMVYKKQNVGGKLWLRYGLCVGK